MRVTLLVPLLVLLLAACGQAPGAGPAASDAPAATAPAGVTQAASPSPGASRAVTVVLTGAPVVAGDGAVVWCPGTAGAGGCPGIPVSGLPDAAVAALSRSVAWQVAGAYDGVTVRATGAPEPIDHAEPDFTTACEDLRGASSETGGMDPAAADAVEQYLATIPDRHAATWWDQQHSVLNVLLTGDDVAAHRGALEEAVGDRNAVCVIGGARWSSAELERMTRRATEIAREEGMGPWSAGPDAVANRVRLDVERSDGHTVARLRDEFGEAVDVRAFMAVRDATLDDLPAAPERGDVALETADTRGGAGMDALGTFTIRFDERQRCVYGEFDGHRLGLVWPFGYWAESDPLRVHDGGGRVVAEEGDVVESGGGQVPRDQRTCGATEVWVMNGPPTVVDAPTP